MKHLLVVKEIWLYLRSRKSLLLFPLILLLLLLGALMAVTESGALAPFIYALF